MSRQVETTLTEAAAKNLSVAATLEWLTDMELEARKQRAIERRFKCSRLQAQPSIDAFHFQHHKTRQQSKPRILRLLDLEFLTKGTNLVLIVARCGIERITAERCFIEVSFLGCQYTSVWKMIEVALKSKQNRMPSRIVAKSQDGSGDPTALASGRHFQRRV